MRRPKLSTLNSVSSLAETVFFKFFLRFLMNMKEGQKLWTKEELKLAINLYCKLPFGRLHKLNPEVIHVAKLIGRTPSSVAYKLVNFASLDPSLKARGIKGASNASKLDAEIWNEFFENWGSRCGRY